MDAISDEPPDHASREEVFYRAVTGHRRRALSLPALPTQNLCLEEDPHAARPTRKPVQSPLKQRTGIEKMAEAAARWKNDAEHRLSLAQESFAHGEAMRLQEASQIPTPIVAPARIAPRSSRNDLQGALRRSSRRVTRPVSGISQFQPPTSRPTASTMSRGVTFALPDDAEESRATVEAPKPSRGSPTPHHLALSHVQGSHAADPSRNSPATPLMRSSSPEPEARTETPELTPVAPVPKMPECQNSVQEPTCVNVAGIAQDIRTDSVLSSAKVEPEANGQEAATTADVTPESAVAEGPPQENVDEEAIAAAYLGYQSFLDDDEDVDRGRRRSRGNVRG